MPARVRRQASSTKSTREKGRLSHPFLLVASSIGIIIIIKDVAKSSQNSACVVQNNPEKPGGDKMTRQDHRVKEATYVCSARCRIAGQ